MRRLALGRRQRGDTAQQGHCQSRINMESAHVHMRTHRVETKATG